MPFKEIYAIHVNTCLISLITHDVGRNHIYKNISIDILPTTYVNRPITARWLYTDLVITSWKTLDCLYDKPRSHSRFSWSTENCKTTVRECYLFRSNSKLRKFISCRIDFPRQRVYSFCTIAFSCTMFTVAHHIHL